MEHIVPGLSSTCRAWFLGRSRCVWTHSQKAAQGCQIEGRQGQEGQESEQGAGSDGCQASLNSVDCSL
eukprot:scaffold65_cov353-Prasinococcus_capsulatus_cf.AAC.8